VVLFAAVSADVFLVGELAQESRHWDSSTTVTPNRTVYYVTVPVSAGDIAHVDRGRWVGDPLEPTAFYAVPPIEVDAIRNGTEPSRSYRAAEIPTDPYPGALGSVRVEAPDGADAIAFAYVYENASSVPVPENPEALGYYLAWADDSATWGAVGGYESPVTVASWAEPVHVAALGLTVVSGLVALLAGGITARHLLARDEGNAGPAERGLDLVETAGAYLDYQRFLLWILGPAILAGFWFSQGTIRELARRVGPTPDWSAHVPIVFLAGWTMIALAWLGMVIRNRRDRQGFDETTDSPPLDL